MNIPQITKERDWLVWKFQVQHAFKAAGQWELITGTANIKAEDHEIKETKGLLLGVTVYRAEIHANSDELSNPKNMWDALCQSFEQKAVSNKIYTLMQLL